MSDAAAGVFVSYRQEASWLAAWLHDRLVAQAPQPRHPRPAGAPGTAAVDDSAKLEYSMQNQASPETPPEMRDLDALRKNWYKDQHAASNRDYWVYFPASYQAGTAAPLIMVLHGCAQFHWNHPWAIAYDTHMNQLAEEHQFLVVYPHMRALPWDDNQWSCWNFFLPWNWNRVGGGPRPRRCCEMSCS